MIDNTTLSLLAMVLGPLSGVAIVLFQNRRSGKNNDATVAVATKEARTHEVEVLLNGYQERVDDLATALKETRAELETATTLLKTQTVAAEALMKRVEQLETDVLIMDEDSTKLLQYVAVIEAMLPEPPALPRPQMRRR